jgi:hypothetical protein
MQVRSCGPANRPHSPEPMINQRALYGDEPPNRTKEIFDDVPELVAKSARS